MDPAPLTIAAAGVRLPALLSLTSPARGLVVFVHGLGSNRYSPRNQAVAAVLQQAGLATVLFDLLDVAEAERQQQGGSRSFHLELFGERLLDSLRWLALQPGLTSLQPVGLFGASSGAAVALWAAADRPDAVGAVVSRGGRPDLAVEVLARVQAPTLLIVGEADRAVLQWNREAALRLRCPHRLEVVPGASHLFEQPGSLEVVARLARDWFVQRLPGATAAETDRCWTAR